VERVTRTTWLLIDAQSCKRGWLRIDIGKVLEWKTHAVFTVQSKASSRETQKRRRGCTGRPARPFAVFL